MKRKPDSPPARPRVALVRGPGLSVFELQSYEPLMTNYSFTAFGLARHSIDTDGLSVPVVKLEWTDSVSGRSVMNAYHSRIRGQRYFMPGLADELSGFDLIHSSEIATTFSWQCAHDKKRRRVPLVITSTENIPYPAWNDPTRSRFKKEILEAADFFFALTPDAGDVLIDEGIEPDRIDIIPFGLDLDRLSPGKPPDAWRDRFGVSEDDFVILYAGRMVWEKGIYDLATAVRRMKPDRLRLLYVGGGRERQSLEAFIRQIGLAPTATCHDPLPYGQMEQLYRLADVVVLPSIPTFGLREQFGMTLAEAMACARPVLATRCGSMPWVIDDAGLLAEPGSSASIAFCLNELRESPALRLRLAERGRALAEDRYDRRKIAAAIGGHFATLLKKAGRV